MTKFFNDLMLDQSAIYTLWGSKPLTFATAYLMDSYSEEEIQAYYDNLSEEEKKNGRIVEDYDLPENWEKWEKISAKFPIKRYLLFRSKFDAEDPHSFYIFFVNVLKTATVIQENYQLFRDTVGFDFDPLEVTLQIQNQDSEFWKIAFHRSLLVGILCGFGRDNSWAFHWKHKGNSKTCGHFLENLKHTSSTKSLRGKVKIDLNNFRIPSFASFDTNDAVVEKYTQERERIKQLYKDQDFLDLTLERLTH